MNTGNEERTIHQGDFLPRMGAGCLVFLGGLIVVIAATSIVSPSHLDLPGFIFYGLVGFGFSVSGIFWLRYITALEQTRRTMFAEKAVLRLAARNDGTATIAHITLHTPLSSDEAEAALERLCTRGVAQPELQEDGSVHYRFRGLLKG
jgi:hypothetical protein